MVLALYCGLGVLISTIASGAHRADTTRWREIGSIKMQKAQFTVSIQSKAFADLVTPMESLLCVFEAKIDVYCAQKH